MGDLRYLFWLARPLAALLSAAFVVALAAVLAFQATNATFGRSSFLADQLERANAYEFVADDLVTAAIADTRRLDGDAFGLAFEENPLVAAGLTTEQLAGAVRRALPPGDLRTLFAPAVAEAGAYTAANTDEVSLSIDFGPHLDAVVAELTALFRESDAYALLLERELTAIFAGWVDEALAPDGDGAGWAAFLRGGDDPGGSLGRVFTAAVTPEWMAARVESAAAELADYIAARSDGFEIRFDLDEAQSGQAASEIEAVIGEADAYDLAWATVIEPAAAERLDEAAELPYGVVLTRADVLEALRGAASAAWIEDQAAMLAEDVAGYVAGRSEGFATTFDLVSLKRTAGEALTATAVAGMADAAAPEMAAAIEESILGRVPDTVVYTDRDLREALERDGGAGALRALDDVRALFTGGWAYTDADMRADLSSDPLELIDHIRSFFSTGYEFETSEWNRSGAPGLLDGLRELVEISRAYGWIAIVVAAGLLLAIAVLGGRSWKGAALWVWAVLALSAGACAVLSGPVYDSLVGQRFDELREEWVEDEEIGPNYRDTADAALRKIADVAEAGLDETVGLAYRISLVLLAVSAVLLAATAAAGRRGGGRSP